MSASMPGSPPGNGGNRVSWQQQLEDHCKRAKLQPPVFNIVSDRRGGRTAWSSTVTVGGRNIAARYWYDGQYLHNAKEDAAEVALIQLNAHDPGQNYGQPAGYGSVSGY